MDNEFKDKFVFIDFYMQNCYWCYQVLEEFNRLTIDMFEFYGTEKIAIVKIDGMQLRQISQKYKVPGYPHFIALLPGTHGQKYSVYKYAPRNYNTLKKWMLEVMGETKGVNGKSIRESIDSRATE